MKTATLFFDSKNALPFFPQKGTFCVVAPMPSSVEILAARAFLGENLRKAEHARYSGAAGAFLLKMGRGQLFE